MKHNNFRHDYKVTEKDVHTAWHDVKAWLIDSGVDVTGWSLERISTDLPSGGNRYDWVLLLPKRHDGARPPYMGDADCIDLGRAHADATTALFAFSAAFGLGLNAAPRKDADLLRRESIEANRLRSAHQQQAEHWARRSAYLRKEVERLDPR